MRSLLERERLRRERLDLFWWFVHERQEIWHRRNVQRFPPPWTADPILQHERFTNVYRELDPGTQYAIQNILEITASKPDKVFNIMLYRLIGRAETHTALGFQHLTTFDARHLTRVLRHLRDVERKPPFTAAYMVSAYSGLGAGDKIESVAQVFAILHADFATLYGKISASHSASQVYQILRRAYGFGNFLAYQVLVDLLYPLDVYGGAPILQYSHDDWASAGPGAQRGIAMLLRDGERASNLEVMRWLRLHQGAEFDRLGLDFRYVVDCYGRSVDLSLADIQNCLCEFHKYVKILEGTGRGRRKFCPVVPTDAGQLSFARAKSG